MVEVPGRGDELLGVEAVARYLEVQPVTIYRWCREGRLPCLKLGKAWRVRRASLDEFLRRAERRRTLVEHLATFFSVPDQVVAVAEDEALLSRLDAAFFQVGEARDGVLVKFYGGEARPLAELRAGIARHGLDVDRLEAEGRFRWSPEVDPARGRDATLRRLMAEEAAAGRTVWASFDWTREVDLEAALRQQEALAGLVDAHPLVVKTGVLEAVADEWSPAAQRRLLGAGRGQLRLTRAGLVLARAVPLPEP
jgi:excisionase family DNA binding protein